MRRYDEPIEVRRGLVHDRAGDESAEPCEGPEQLLWRNQLWVVREILARWLETGPWWDGPDARAVRGESLSGTDRSGTAVMADLLIETEVWRVAAINGRHGRSGVLELTYRYNTGEWRLRSVMD